MLAAVLVIGCLPFDWENTLVGFQNQFYLMAAGAMLLVAIAAYRRLSWSTCGLLATLAVATLFTMASGLLAPLAAIAVLALQAWRTPDRPGIAVAIVAFMLAAAVAGLMLTPSIAGHAILKAQGLAEHVRAFFTFLLWPLQPLTGKRSPFLLAIWWPLLAWVFRFLRTRRTTDGELFAVGMLVWVLLQAAAFAHARGHDATELTSRYSNIPALGLLANLALALLGLQQVTVSAQRRGVVVLVALSTILIGTVLMHRLPMDMTAMRQRHQFLLIETHYTQAYLRDHNPDDLRHPGLMIPFISGDALREMLDKPGIVNLLPPVLFDQAAASGIERRGGWLTHGAVTLQDEMQRVLGHTDHIATVQATSSPDERDAGQGQCYIDALGSVPAQHSVALRNGDPLQLDGWVIDSSMAHSADFDVLLVGTATYSAPARAYGTRYDVVKALHSHPGSTRAFSALGVLEGMPAGDYAIVLAKLGHSGHVICRPGQTVHIER
jgi:hypothetical protein